MDDPKRIIPELWKNADDITAAFSLRNPTLNPEGKMPGLNLGMISTEVEEEVNRNRKYWLESLGGTLDGLAVARQVHGNHVAVIEKPGNYPDTDALVTTEINLWLGIQVADCASVLLADRHHRVAAAAHAGWRDSVANIVPETVKKMIAQGATAPEIEAYISPCISQKNFEVGEEVAERFPKDLVDYQSYEKPHPDLKSLLKRQLVECGLVESQIEVSEHCTMEDDKNFYSHRLQNGNTGRMMAVIALH